MFRNVLVGLSLAPASSLPARVLREAIEVADQHHGRLTIFTILPECRACACGPIETYTAARDTSADLWREGQALQRAALEEVPACLPVSTILRQGPTWPNLMRELRSGHHDSVVVGASARSGVARLLRRPVDARLARCSPVPVLVVSPDGPPNLYVSRPAYRGQSADAPRMMDRPDRGARRAW